MPEHLLYEYAVMRLVPYVERAEFLNIGVLLFCAQKRFLSLRFEVNETRIRCFSPREASVFISLAQQQMTAFSEICKGSVSGGSLSQETLAYRFRWLAANRSTIIQSSKVHPGFCKDPERKLEDLFEKMVL